MPINVDQLKAHLIAGGARPSLFKVQITGLTIANMTDLEFFCKASQIPAQTMSVIPVPYQGRQIKFPGTRTFEPWTITVINDENFRLRSSFEKWNGSLNRHEANVLGYGATPESNSYQAKAHVFQIGKDGSTLAEYKFHNVWCSSVAAIPLDWGQGDTIEEFSVTLEHDYFERVVVAGGTGVENLL